MEACEVCLDLEWDLYPLSKEIDVRLEEVISSASQGCVPCKIIYRGIKLIEEKVVLPAGGRPHIICPCLLQIRLRENRCFTVEVRSLDDAVGSKNYSLDLDFFSTGGNTCPPAF